jgi:hypothetical protein
VSGADDGAVQAVGVVRAGRRGAGVGGERARHRRRHEKI